MRKMTKMDKLWLLTIFGLLLAVTIGYEMTDGAAIRAEAAKANKPPALTVTAPPIDCTPLVEAVEAIREELIWQDVPLDQEFQKALQESCESSGVPICLALGLIEAESGFDPEAVSPDGCVGLTQLNPKYFQADLSASDNIRAGVAYFGELLEKYGDTAAAIRAYNLGHDDGDRVFANVVLAASEKWWCG